MRAPKQIIGPKQEEFDVPVLAIAIILCNLAGIAGAIFVAPSLPNWYANLRQTPLTPPNWVFAPVWTTLYILMGISIYFIWQKRREAQGARHAFALFGIQLVLNIVWAFLFFGLHSPLLGFIGILPLWLSVLLCILSFRPIDERAACLLIPYLLWVTFAGLLNLSILVLNP